VRRAWHGSPLPGFFAWWGAELAASLPAPVRAWLGRGPTWLALDVSASTLSLHHVGDPHVLVRIDPASAPDLQRSALREGLAGIDPSAWRVALCLPPAAVLRRRVVLPVAARGDLRQALAWEMDRQTPFRADEVYYDVRAAGAVSGNRLAVELVVAPHAQVDPWLHQLALIGLGIDAVDVSEEVGRSGFNLLPPAQRARRPDPRRRLNWILAVIAVVLAVLAMHQWVANRCTALAAMQTEVGSLRVQARQVAAMHRTLAGKIAASRFLAQHRAQSATVIDVLDDLTHRLPDATWLERLSVDGDQVAMQGQSPQATALLERLKGSALLGEPRFQGVIQTDPQTGKERFYLIAQRRAAKAADPAEVAHARPVAH
jgi:general secretion pathway protein L